VNQRPSRAGYWLLAILLLLSAGFRTVPAAAASEILSAPNPGPGDLAPELYSALLPSEQQRVYAELAGRLSRYRYDVAFTPAGEGDATIAGTLDLSYFNDTGTAQETLYLRLYPNGAEYADGGLTLDSVDAGGVVVEPELSMDETVAALPLPEPLAANGVIELSIRFTTTIPTNPEGSYGMFREDDATGVYALAHWGPLLAGYDPARGWNLEPVSVFGDPVFTNTALFDVTLTAPDELIFVTTGTESSSESEAGLTIHRYVSGPSRDFVMAASERFKVAEEKAGETLVRSWYLPEDAVGGDAVLTYGAQSIETYSELFGPYPYEELDLVQVNLGGGAAGVEFPQLTFIGGAYYGDALASAALPGFLEFVVTHEIAHQWWYGLVGNDQYFHAFLDEALANYASVVYIEERYGDDASEWLLANYLELPYFDMLFGLDGDQVVDTPTDDFSSQSDYATTIYNKGALGFQAIHDAIGDDAFFDALQAYAAEYSFRIAQPDDLLAAFEAASGEDLTALWQHWFEAAKGDQDFDESDVEHALGEAGR
jgi:hypothetical protein